MGTEGEGNVDHTGTLRWFKSALGLYPWQDAICSGALLPRKHSLKPLRIRRQRCIGACVDPNLLGLRECQVRQRDQ